MPRINGRFNSLRCELYRGIVSRWYWYLLLFCISSVFCFYMHIGMTISLNADELVSMPSTMDYLLYLFKGMHVYNESSSSTFQIPYIWLTINLYIAFTAANYLTNDLRGFGIYILIHSKARVGWYLSKSMWLTLNVVSCYFVIFLSTLLVSAISGNVSFEVSGQALEWLLGANYSNASLLSLVGYVLLLPLVTSLAMSFVQIFIELISNSILAFTIIAFSWLSAIYMYTPFLFGNFAVVLRTELVMGDDGLRFTHGMFINLCIIVGAITAGCKYFSKYNVLGKI